MPKTVEVKEIDWTDPVAVLRAAADDMELCIKDPKVTFNMESWYVKLDEAEHADQGITCSVCMAGAVMYNRFNQVLVTDNYGYGAVAWDDVNVTENSAFKALDCFRDGAMECFYDNFGSYLGGIYDDIYGFLDRLPENLRGDWSYDGALSGCRAQELIKLARDFANEIEGAANNA